MNDINIVSQIGKLKDTDYRNTLAIATLIELLIEKDIITKQEFSMKSYQLDNLSLADLKKRRKKI